MRLTWEQYGLTLAHTVALRSDCTRSQVGAVLLDSGNRVVATGYNGAPAGQPGCATCPRAQSKSAPGSSYENCVAVHAEANCLLYAGRERSVGGTLYITREPCHECARLIAAAGVARVVVGE